MKKTEDKTDGCDGSIQEGDPLASVKHNSLSTVHPNLILRSQVFTPVARNPHTKKIGRTADISETMRELTFARAEGYDQVTIYGAKLDIETDFRVWCGITRLFETIGFQAEGTKIDFKEFAALCSYPSKQFNATLRNRIDRSLVRIMSQVITFAKPDGSKFHTHLIHRAEYLADSDTIRVVPDVQLWELYRIDHNILLSMEHQESLRRREVAQCLYIFIEALPSRPAPLSFSRLRERCALTATKVAEANRSITNGLAELKKINYLDYEIVTRDGERYVLIHSRTKPRKKNA